MSADVATLEQHATALAARLASEGRPLFTGPEAPLLARAPGRLDVMGGIGDYSGSLTLEMPIAEAAFVAVQRVESDRVRVVSAGFGKAPGPLRDVSFPLAELAPACESHAAARRLFSREPGSAWAAYVAGALAALRVEHGVRVGTGLDILVCSSVPEGKGVSSSAAIEVASLLALAALAGLPLEPVQAALACQRVENLVVGAACGAMDQLTAACGSEGQLLPILCQPAQLEPALPIPPGLRFWGIDSGVRHAVSGSGYTDVRVAAFMGYTLIARALGIPLRASGQSGKLVADDTLFRGYLANVGVERFERELSARLPEQLSGAAFLSEHGGIIDPVTEVAPERTYRVRAATAHPIHEHARVTEFCSLLQSAGEAAAPRLGSLMYGAHASYGACGLGAAGTDRLVELVRAAGPARGLHGAKITGGGSGGTVAVLGSRDALPAVLEVVDRYARETGLEPQLFSGSSPGAASFGIRRLLRESAGYRVSGRVDGIAVASRSGGT